MNIKEKFADARLACLIITLMSALALMGAWTAEYGFGLKPCPLCMMQRIPYLLTIALSLGGFLAINRGHAKAAALCVFLCGLAFLVGSGLAFYHAGVEQHWWASFLEGCKINFDQKEGGLLAQIEGTAAVPCDKIAWTDPVLHLSMAAWNAVVSMGLAVGGTISSILIARKANGVL